MPTAQTPLQAYPSQAGIPQNTYQLHRVLTPNQVSMLTGNLAADPTSPFQVYGSPFQRGEMPFVGDPGMWRAPIETRNLAIGGILGQLGIQGTPTPYGPSVDPTSVHLGYNASPGRGGMMDLLNALQGSAGRASRDLTPFAPQPGGGGFSTDVMNLAAPAMRGLALQEPGRQMDLLNQLMGAYQLGGRMYGTQQGIDAQQRAIKNRLKAAQNQEYRDIASSVGDALGAIASKFYGGF